MRTPVGDLELIDVCGAVPLSAFSTIGERAAYEPRQYPAGCVIDLSGPDRTTQQLTVTMDNHGDVDTPGETTVGTTRRKVDGLPVDTFEADAGSGACEQIIGHRSVDIELLVFGDRLSRARGCSLVDAAIGPLVSHLRTGRFARLPVDNGSLTSLDLCKLGRSTLSQLPIVLQGAGSSDENANGSCTFTGKPSGTTRFQVSLFLVFDRDSPPARTVPVNVDGHSLFEVTKVQVSKTRSTKACVFVSVHNRLANGAHEELEVSSVDVYSGASSSAGAVPFAQACAVKRTLIISALNNAKLP